MGVGWPMRGHQESFRVPYRASSIVNMPSYRRTYCLRCVWLKTSLTAVYHCFITFNSIEEDDCPPIWSKDVPTITFVRPSLLMVSSPSAMPWPQLRVVVVLETSWQVTLGVKVATELPPKDVWLKGIRTSGAKESLDCVIEPWVAVSVEEAEPTLTSKLTVFK